MDNRFKEVLEYFLDNDSGDEFEGFMLEDLRSMGGNSAASVEQNSDDSETDAGEESSEIPDRYRWEEETRCQTQYISDVKSPCTLTHASRGANSLVDYRLACSNALHTQAWFGF